MPRWSRPPLFAVAAALLALIALLATLQYQWLGRISDAERERMKSTLSARAAAFAEDFDRELTLAFMLFQVEPPIRHDGVVVAAEDVAARLAARYDRWQTTARYPRLVKDYFVVARVTGTPVRLQRFAETTRTLEDADWPAALEPIRAQIADTREEKTSTGTLVFRTMATALWEEVPALVVPSAPAAMVMLRPQGMRPEPGRSAAPLISYTVLVLDRDYIAAELLPALAAQHFRGTDGEAAYRVAVVSPSGSSPIYRSNASFTPRADAAADATADLFQVRPQEFPQLAADVRRFAAFAVPSGGQRAHTVTTFTLPAPPEGGARARDDGTGRTPLSVIVEQSATVRERTVVGSLAALQRAGGARWRLLVTHPSGSLETAVNSVRRRNLLISTSILGVLTASMVLIVVSTRRSQELARRQMEFVAAVSHELRTPLAVIRSAADNLADGVVQDDQQVRKYGALVRTEGRRLTEMVEQILEFAGIHSGQRTLRLVPVRIDAVIGDALAAFDTLIEAAALKVDVDVPGDLPPVAGDEAALRRAFQNLIGNAIKYGADGGWIGVSARRIGAEVSVTIGDRGIGIAPADHQRIFDPFYRAADVVEAQVQGAGLGLSLVQRIVQAHGGRITVRSAKGAGSEFTVYLSAAAPDAHQQSVGLPTAATPSPGS